MKKSYPNSAECTAAVLKEVYGWNDPAETLNVLKHIESFLKEHEKYFRYTITDNGFIINHDFQYEGNKWKADIKYTYNPNSDFNCFASSASTHDGTFLFIYENIRNCIKDLLYLRAKEWKPLNIATIREGDNAEVIFGDITMADAIKPEFGTEEKPWRQERTIIVIPTKLNIERANQIQNVNHRRKQTKRNKHKLLKICKSSTPKTP